MNQKLIFIFYFSFREAEKEKKNHLTGASKSQFSHMKVTRKIDVISFCVFSTCFIIYNLAYWY